ncbi:MAG: hypothetical protein HC842_05560 [Cytophagales bacterium]|nr:hypothetical protein [Cytophagales bacterium]
MRLEDEVFACKSKADLASLLAREPVLAEDFLYWTGYPSDSAAVEALWVMFSHPAMDTLYQEVKARFPEGLSELGPELKGLFARLQEYYPQAQVPQIKTCLSGLQNDLYLSDTLVVIGLDYFIGPTARWRPKLYEYMLRRFDKPYIAPQLALLVANRYNSTSTADQSALAE